MCFYRYWQSQFDEDFKYVPELRIQMVQLQAKMKENQDNALLEYIQTDQMYVGFLIMVILYYLSQDV